MRFDLIAFKHNISAPQFIRIYISKSLNHSTCIATVNILSQDIFEQHQTHSIS